MSLTDTSGSLGGTNPITTIEMWGFNGVISCKEILVNTKWRTGTFWDLGGSPTNPAGTSRYQIPVYDSAGTTGNFIGWIWLTS